MKKKRLSALKKARFASIISKKNGIRGENEAGRVTKAERIDLKSYAIKEKLKLKRYVRD